MITATLYPEYRQQAWRYARWITRNDWDADEVVQDAFCRLAERESLGQLPETEREGMALLFTVIRNRAIDLLRRRKTRLAHSGKAGELVDPGVGTRPETSLQLRELEADVQAALETLPDQWSEALGLRVYGDLSYDEIADVLGCTRNQVRTWIFRARRELAKELADHLAEN